MLDDKENVHFKGFGISDRIENKNKYRRFL